MCFYENLTISLHYTYFIILTQMKNNIYSVRASGAILVLNKSKIINGSWMEVLFRFTTGNSKWFMKYSLQCVNCLHENCILTIYLSCINDMGYDLLSVFFEVWFGLDNLSVLWNKLVEPEFIMRNIFDPNLKSFLVLY